MKGAGIALAIVLFLIPVLIIIYRGFSLGYPLLPLSLGRIWQVTMEARIIPREREITLEVALPFTYDGRRVAQEKITSGSRGYRSWNRGRQWNYSDSDASLKSDQPPSQYQQAGQ